MPMALNLLRWHRQAVLERDEGLRAFVIQRLSEGWTPEQIAGRLKERPGARARAGLSREHLRLL